MFKPAERAALKKPTEDWKCKNMSDRIFLSCLLSADYTANPNRFVAMHGHICEQCVYIQNVLVRVRRVCAECMRVFSQVPA